VCSSKQVLVVVPVGSECTVIGNFVSVNVNIVSDIHREVGMVLRPPSTHLPQDLVHSAAYYGT